MKTVLIPIFFILLLPNISAQTDSITQEMVPMSVTFQKAYKRGWVYYKYKTGTKTPFTGVLYGKYSNVNYQILI